MKISSHRFVQQGTEEAKRRPGRLLGFGLFLLVFALVSCSTQEIGRTPADEILVDAQWLSSQGGNVTILDTGRSLDDYLTGHLPGAVWADRSIAWAEVDGIAGMLPDPNQVARDFAALGVSSDTPVVIYDSGNSLWAARLFWALEYLGHEQAHVLEGGIAGWTSSGESLATGGIDAAAGEFSPRVQDELIADISFVRDAITNDNITLVDTRSSGEYDGTDVRAARGGKIPGSVNIEWVENLGSAGGFKPALELAQQYANQVAEEGTAVTFCQTGVRGAHSYLALRVAGYEDVRLYDGSWAEWGNDPDTPIDS